MGEVLVIVQARTTSTRLPNKINLELSPGESMLYHVCKRAQKLGDVFVATPPPDLDENDVLGRFWRVAELHPEVDTFVRITADCPLLDWQFSLSLLDYFQSRRPELSFVGTGPELDGLDTEVFSRMALEWANGEEDPKYREHVTKRMREHFSWYKKIVTFPNQGPFRWSVDDEAGLAFVRQVFAACDLCRRGVPHHSNALGSIGGMDGRAPRWDLHAADDGGLVECTAYEIRLTRMGGEVYESR